MKRRTAILEIGESQDVRGLALISPLRSESWEAVRQAVATAIGRLGDPGGAEFVIQMLADRDPEVIRESLKALRCLKQPLAVRPLLVLGLDNPLLKLQATETIAQIGESVVPELLEVVETQSEGMVLDAIVALGRIGGQSTVPTLVASLDHASSPIRGHAAEALGRIGHREALSRIIRLLDEPDQYVRLHAIQALRHMPTRRASRALMRSLLEAGNPELRRQAVLALGATQDPRAVPAIARLLPDANDALRDAIAEALGLLGDPAACDALRSLLRNGTPEIQVKAIKALKKSKAAEASDDLFALTNSPNPTIRRHVVEALAEIGSLEADSVFADLLHSDTVHDVRVAAAKGLGQLGNPESAATLERALRDEAPVRCAAVMSLAKLGDSKVTPALIASLRDPAPEVRYHAVAGLGRLKAASAIQPVQSMLEDSDAMVRKGAEKALEALGIQQPRVTLGRRLSTLAGRLVPDSLIGSTPVSALATIIIVAVAGVAGGAMFLLKDSIGGDPPHLIMSRASTIRQVDWLPGSEQLVVARTNGHVEFWGTGTGEFIRSRQNVPSRNLRYNPETGQLLLQNAKGFLSWDFTEEGIVPVAYGPPLPSGYSSVIPATHSGVCLVGMKPTPGQREYRIWRPDAGENGDVTLTLIPDPAPAISGDGTRIAGTAPKVGLSIFSAEDGRVIGRVNVPDADEHPNVTALIMNRDGSLLAGLAGRELLRIQWKTPSTPVAEWIELPNSVSHARFASAGVLTCVVQGERVGRIEMSSGTLESWPVTSRDIELTTLSANSDVSMVVASGQDEKLAWLINTTDGSVQELSPVDIPQQLRDGGAQ